MSPRVSVIMPVYNGARTVARSIASVLGQSFDDFELIVVDDGSTDNTRQMVSGIQDTRVRLEKRGHEGRSLARNYGASVSGGDYFAFMDADDLWMPDKLAIQVRALEGSLGAGAVYGWTDYIDDSDDVIFPGCHLFPSGKVYKDLLVNPFLESGSNIMVTRQAFSATDGFDRSWEPSEDWEWAVRVARGVSFIGIPQVLVHYRVSLAASSGDLKRFRGSMVAVIDHNFQQAPEELQVLRKNALRNIEAHMLLRTIELYLLRRPYLGAATFFWHKVLSLKWLRSLGRKITSCLYGS